MLETLRAFGLDRLAAAGENETPRPALRARWAVELTAWIGATALTEREPEADAALRRELANLRAAWRLARGRGSSTTPRRWSPRCSTRSPTATWSRSGAGPRSWPTTRRSPATRRRRGAGHRRRGRLPPRRLPTGRAARAGRARAGDRRRRVVGTACCRCRWPPWPAGRTPRPSSTPWPRPGARPGPAKPRDRRPRRGLRRRPRPGADAERAGARRRGVALDARLGRLRRRGDREPRPAVGAGRAALRASHRPGPALGRDLPRRRRDRRAARGAGRRRPASTRRCAATARSSTTSPAPATGPTSGPPCATSPTCCAGSATTSRRRCSTPPPTGRRTRPPATSPGAPRPPPAGPRSSAGPPSSRWPGGPSSATSRARDPRGRSLGDRAAAWLDEGLVADPRRVAVHAQGGDEARPSGSAGPPAPRTLRAATSGSSTRSTASRSSGVVTG